MYPTDYLYTKEHEWLKVTGSEALVGITDHAQDQLGDIVFVELPEVGKTFSAGDEFGTVESVKAVAEVFMPIDAEILETNANLEDEPELVNKDPHNAGWMVKIAISNPDQLKGMMDHAAYAVFVEEESK
ncbi:MAG: glycine cleavage system protein GcvH [Acidobacteria bacterium]|nr:glycine cleavage system protein GcvH [Acidobacteriota bacterium]MCB9398872.1 glycine cleavage system protein GcvH [Acidobacteriota bacterium]